MISKRVDRLELVVWRLPPAVSSLGDARAQALDKLTIVIFAPPSLGAFMPPVIKAKKLDADQRPRHHLRTSARRTPTPRSSTPASSRSAAARRCCTVGLADARGVKVKYLFNLFDYWGAVVTSRPEVKTLKDLEGKQLAAARVDHQLRDVRVLRQEAGRRCRQDPGGQHRAARPGRLCDRRPRRRGADSGSRPIRCCWPRSRASARSTSASTRPGRRSPAAAASPISASPRIPTGSSRTRRRCTKLYATYKEAASGSRRIRTKRRR